MSIRNNIEAVMEQIRNGNETVGQGVREKAVAAIKGGQGSEGWTAYMEQFSQSPEQFARLAPDQSVADEFDVARTYLVGNGTCGAETTGGGETGTGTGLIFGVWDKLDEGLEG